MSKLLLKFNLWLLKHKKLKGEEKTKVLNALLENIGALPLTAVLFFDQDGTLKVNGKALEVEQAISIREGAVALMSNPTYILIKQQIAFLAVTEGIHKSLNSDMLLFSKAALWIQAREKELIELLQGNLRDL